MYTMDLKCKGITWVGNIYQKIEAMCLEVEDNMYQETTKYVENQVQFVGSGVKNFYAELMQDLLPPSFEDSVKGVDSDLPIELNADIGTCKKSKEGIEEDPVKEKTPPAKEFEAVAPDGKHPSHGSSFSGFPNENHLLPPYSVDPIEGAGIDLYLEQHNDVVTYEKLKVGIEEYTVEGVDPDLLNADIGTCKKSKEGIEEDPVKEKPPPLKELEAVSPDGKDLSHGSSLVGFPNETQLLPPSSVVPIKGAGIDQSLEQCNDVVTYENLMVGIKEYAVKENMISPQVSDVIAPAGKDLSAASIFSGVHKENNEKGCNMAPKMSTLSSVAVTRSNFPSRAGKIHNDLEHATWCSSDILSVPLASDLLLPVSSGENKVAEIGLTPSTGIISMESKGIGISTTDEVISLMGSSGNGQECYNNSAELQDIFPPTETGRSDGDAAEGMATRLGVETIEAFDTLKLEDSYILVDGNELHFASQRAGKHRSYKKKIRDAFASKMRSRKKQECERLAMWCGDINTGINEHRTESYTLSILNGELDSKELQIHDFCESDWERV